MRFAIADGKKRDKNDKKIDNDKTLQSTLLEQMHLQIIHYTRLLRITVERGSPNDKSFYTIVRGPDILCSAIDLVLCYILENQQSFRKHTVALLKKCLRGPDDMAWRAGLGPWTIVWNPLL